MKINKEHILLTCILVVGITARIVKFGDPANSVDMVSFAHLGKNLIEYGRYVFGENFNLGVHFPPGYPISIGIVNLFLNDLMFSAKIVSFISSCITIFLSYLIGKELYNKEAGLFAALVFALYPVILIISIDAYSEALFFCFLLLSVYTFIVSLKNNSIYRHLLFSIFAAAAFLTRPEGVFLLLLPGLQLFGLFNKKIQFNKKYLLKIALIISIVVLIVSPYMMFLKNYTGNFALSGKSKSAVIIGELGGDKTYHEAINAPDNPYDKAVFSLTEDKTQMKGWIKNKRTSLIKYIMKDPLNVVRRYLKNILQEVELLIKLLIPIFLPLFFTFFNRELFSRKTRLICIIFPMIFFFIYPLFLILERQMLIIVVFLILFSSSGFSLSQTAIDELAGYYGIKKNRAVLLLIKNIKIIIIVLFLAGSGAYVKYSHFGSNPWPVEHKKAGFFLKAALSPEYEQLNVMGRKPFVSFYSDARFTMLPYAGSVDVINFAKLYKVDYIVVDERFLQKWDYYNEIQEMHKYSDEVELAYEDDSGMPIRLFKINY